MTTRMGCGVLTLITCLGLTSVCSSDIGPKPIKDTGAWNTADRFRLVVNRIAITLGKDAAHVDVCLCLLSTKTIHHWNKGKLVWLWPVPSDLPDPQSLAIATAVEFIGGDPWDPKYQRKAISEFRSRPCRQGHLTDSEFDERYKKPWKARGYRSLGIARWLEVREEFVVYRPAERMAVQIRVSYDQPYAVVSQSTRLRQFAYVLRTGALWQGPIEYLHIEVRPDAGVEIMESNLRLQDGVYDSTAVEPADDLRLQLRLIAP